VILARRSMHTRVRLQHTSLMTATRSPTAARPARNSRRAHRRHARLAGRPRSACATSGPGLAIVGIAAAPAVVHDNAAQSGPRAEEVSGTGGGTTARDVEREVRAAERVVEVHLQHAPTADGTYVRRCDGPTDTTHESHRVPSPAGNG
jgi:hypothetical protein